MRHILLLLLLLSLNATAQIKPSPIVYPVPVFTDTARITKIRQLLPMLEQMYKDFAVSIHAPGMSYSIIVDGKVFAIGGTGFINLEKKLPATSQSAFR